MKQKKNTFWFLKVCFFVGILSYVIGLWGSKNATIVGHDTIERRIPPSEMWVEARDDDDEYWIHSLFLPRKVSTTANKRE